MSCKRKWGNFSPYHKQKKASLHQPMGLPTKTSQTYQGKEVLMLGMCWCCLIHANANSQDRTKGHNRSLNKLRYRGFEIKNNDT